MGAFAVEFKKGCVKVAEAKKEREGSVFRRPAETGAWRASVGRRWKARADPTVQGRELPMRGIAGITGCGGIKQPGRSAAARDDDALFSGGDRGACKEGEATAGTYALFVA